MRKQLPVRALSYLKTHMQKKKWRRVVTVLSCIVVFCTTYALILPAITMTQQTHVHTPEDCYERVLICGQEQAEPAEHVHTDACYQEQAILICGAAEGEGAHLHTQDCFDEAGNAVCGLDESAGHEHTDDCYRTGWVLVCELEEHQHSLACYSDPEADLESPAVWERTIPQDLTEDLAANVAAVAALPMLLALLLVLLLSGGRRSRRDDGDDTDPDA